MKNKNILRCSLAGVAALLCTGLMAGGVYSASNNSLLVTDKVQFTADSYVNADVKVLINEVQDASVTFSDVKNSDDNQSITISKIEGDKWLDNTATTENEIDKIATVSFVITNTSDYSKLDVEVARTGSGENCEIINPELTTASGLEKSQSATFTYTFKVDGRLDVEEFTNTYSVTLEAHK